MYPSATGGAYRSVRPKMSRMHEHTMVREYPDQAAFRLDEQTLGQQGWSVAATGKPDHQVGLLARLWARLATPQGAAPIVVTYTRGQPS